MNKKNLTTVLIIILSVNLVVRLSFISFYSGRLLELFSENILNGNLFQAHILSHRSSFFWFNLIDSLIPHIIILMTLIGIVSYYKSKRTIINRYLIITIILSYFPVLPELMVWLPGFTAFSAKQYFFYDSVWSLFSLITYYAGFIYVIVYFILFNSIAEVSEEKAVETANLKTRFKNYLADTLYLSYLSLRLLQFFSEQDERYFLIIYICASFLYYFYCEYLFAQSIGKSLTQTVVIFEGNRLAGSLIRTLARKIPFEPFSFFLEPPSGRWHDKLSNSRVILFTKK